MGLRDSDDEDGGRRFGCVIFDDPQDPASGWYSVGSTYDRIASPGQLSTNTIWWSNITYETFYKATEVWRQPNLRHDKYHVVTIEDSLREWGHDPKKVSVEFVCKFASIIFDRIMRCAYLLLRDVNPKVRMSDAFTGKTLREDMRGCIPELEYPRGESAMVMKRGLAYEEFTPTGAKGPRGSRRIVLRRPRVSYTMEMLHTPVPRGPYELLDRQALRQLTANRVQYVLEAEQPMMADVSLTVQPDVSSIYGFGAAADKSKRAPRSWVPHSEIIALARFAEIEIRNVWKAESYWGMMNDVPDPVREFLTSRHTDVSWTAGIVAETLWRVVALGQDSAKARLGPGEERADTSWQGLWLKGADKTAMFMTALRLSELGYSVGSYGLGWIRCSVAEEEIDNYIRDGLTLGLVPQLTDVTPGMFTPNDIPWGGDKKSGQYLRLMLMRQTDFLWNLDRIALAAPGRRDDLLKAMHAKIKGGAARQKEDA